MANMNERKKIFIYGVPGTGKTYFSKILGKQLNVPVVNGDQLRKNFRKNKQKSEFPFLYFGTCTAYKMFGGFTPENVIKGLISVRKALWSTVLKELRHGNNFVLEGAFLDPNKLKKYGKVILLTVLDERQHKKQFLHHIEKLFDISENEFKAARIIQKYFLKEAKKFNIEIIDGCRLDENTNTISF